MLAQNFLAAADLGISDKERDALIATLALFEGGEIEHRKIGIKLSERHDFDAKPDAFNMSFVRCATDDCGTTGCILGWSRWLAEDEDLLRGGERTPEINNLFGMSGHHCPDTGELVNAFVRFNRCSSNIKPDEAAHALRNYLITGKADWHSVFAASKAAASVS